jgi:Ca2+-binding EF-hand superfamily protein
VPVQIEFEEARDEWEPIGYRTDWFGCSAYKKVELCALIEEVTTTHVPAEIARLSIDDGPGGKTLLPTGGGGAKVSAGDGSSKHQSRQVCYVASYTAEDDTLTVSRGYSNCSGGHGAGKLWKLLRVPHQFGPSLHTKTAFSGAWQCENNDFYQGMVVEIEPDGDSHRWFPRGGTLANYFKVDLIDLVELLGNKPGRQRPRSMDDGGERNPQAVEQHHVCSLSASGHTLTVSHGYGDDGHSGAMWTLNRILDCGGESLASQLFARTYKYMHASEASIAAYEEATSALQSLQTVEFNGAREMATKLSQLGVAQAWSVDHLDVEMRRRNHEVLQMVVSILRRYPELVCEVHGTTTTTRTCDPDLAAFFHLDPAKQMKRAMDCLARERAAACVDALVARGVEARRLRVTFKGCAGAQRVYFIARATFRSPVSYDPNDEADAIFSQYDTGNSGSIDMTELRVCLNELGVQTDTRGAVKVLEGFDANENGKLDFFEFKKLVLKLRQYQSRLANRYDPQDATDNVLMQFDVDGSGEIDVVEVRDALNALQIVTDDAGATGVMRKYDSDHSGRLEHAEFKRLVIELRAFQASRGVLLLPSGGPLPGSTESTPTAIFRRFDADNSGDLDVAKVNQALNELGLSVDSAGAADLLSRYDTDGNGRLSLPEFSLLVTELRAFQQQSAAPPTQQTPDSAAGAHETVGQVFRRFDTDGSGDIDVAGSKQALNALGLSAATAVAADVLAKYNTDGNGRLSLSEFRLLVKGLRRLRAKKVNV